MHLRRIVILEAQPSKGAWGGVGDRAPEGAVGSAICEVSAHVPRKIGERLGTQLYLEPGIQGFHPPWCFLKHVTPWLSRKRQS